MGVKANSDIMDVLDKRALFNGQEIRQKLIELLRGSNESIHLAMAWFTDAALFDELEQALGRGVLVQLVIGDNEDNQRLPFEGLAEKGADVLKLKGKGRGIMHQKYVVIDEMLVASGSYNWTHNAASNNSENLQIITDMKTVGEYVANFKDLLNGVRRVGDQENDVEEKEASKFVEEKGLNPGIDEKNSLVNDFSAALNEMVYAHFNKEEAKDYEAAGRESSKQYNGEPSALENELDSIKGHLIVGMKDAHREMLIQKVEDLKESYGIHIEAKLNSASKSLEDEVSFNKSQLIEKKTRLQREIDELDLKIREQRNDIDNTEKEQEENAKEQQELEVKYATHKINWPKLSFKLTVSLILVGYLFIFYSSAIYILMHAEVDAQGIVNSGGTPTPPGIFESEAWVKGIEKGGGTTLFLAFGVLLPLLLATSSLFVKPKWLGHALSVILGIFGFDFFVAWKVSKTDHDIRFLSGLTGEEWQWADLWADSDFYLVFMFGAMGLLFFKFLATNVYAAFHANDKAYVYSVMRVEQKALKKKADNIRSKLDKANGVIDKMELERDQLDGRKDKVDDDLAELITSFQEKQQELKTNNSNELSRIERIANQYKGRIEAGNIAHMWRVVESYYTEFINGWTQFLFEFFATKVALDKQLEATRVYRNWKELHYSE